MIWDRELGCEDPFHAASLLAENLTPNIPVVLREISRCRIVTNPMRRRVIFNVLPLRVEGGAPIPGLVAVLDVDSQARVQMVPNVLSEPLDVVVLSEDRHVNPHILVQS